MLKYIAVGISVLIVMCLISFILYIVVTLENGWYLRPFETSTVSGMTKYHNTTLYPYNGSWNSTTASQTVNQCITTCDNDSSCLAFFIHNDLANTSDQGTCYFYTGNNTNNFLSSGTDVDSYFTTKLTIGAQLYGNYTDTYVKTSTDKQIFRSYCDQTKIVS